MMANPDDETDLDDLDDLDDEEDNIESDVAEYSSKSDFSKAKIVFEAMQKCISARAKEMRAGYYNIKLTKEGSPIKMWVEDSRQVFIGSVIALKGLLSPEIMNNEDYKKSIEKKEEEKDEIKTKYIYKEKLKQNDKGIIIFKETGKQFVPEIGARVILPDITNPQIAREVSGGWDIYVNAYWDELRILYDKVFEILNKLINHLNYFKQALSF